MNKAIKIFYFFIVLISTAYTTFILSEFIAQVLPYFFSLVIALIIAIGTHLVTLIAVKEYLHTNSLGISVMMAGLFISAVAVADFYGSHSKSILSYQDEITNSSANQIAALKAEIESITTDQNYKVRKWMNDKYIYQLSNTGAALIQSKQKEIEQINQSKVQKINSAETKQIAVIWALRFVALILYSFVIFFEYYLESNRANNVLTVSKNSDSTREIRESAYLNESVIVAEKEDKNRIGFAFNQDATKLEKLYIAYASGERNFAKLSKASGLNGKQIKTLLEKI